MPEAGGSTAGLGSGWRVSPPTDQQNARRGCPSLTSRRIVRYRDQRSRGSMSPGRQVWSNQGSRGP